MIGKLLGVILEKNIGLVNNNSFYVTHTACEPLPRKTIHEIPI